MRDFEAAYREYDQSMRRIARNTRLPGMDADDVFSELSLCLWRACVKYDVTSTTTFGGYWWSIWLNRKRDIWKKHYALGNIDAIPVDELPEGIYTEPMFPTIQHHTAREARVWQMLGEGATPSEAQEGMSKRQYYKTIKAWRTPEVRSALTD